MRALVPSRCVGLPGAPAGQVRPDELGVLVLHVQLLSAGQTLGGLFPDGRDGRHRGIGGDGVTTLAWNDCERGEGGGRSDRVQVIRSPAHENRVP